MNNITATLPRATQSNGKNLSGQKELLSAMSAAALIDGKMREVVIARWYKARKSDGASPVYASIWTNGAGFGISGYGRATGYGYHKASAALAAAIDSAGIVLSMRIDGVGDGVGDGASRSALEAIARAIAGDAAEILIINHA